MPIPRQLSRLYVPLSEINDTDRVRQDYGDLEQLKDSLKSHGLLQPIVLDQNKRLIAGGRRLRAHRELGEAEISVVFYETLSDLQLRILEVEENVVRKDFDWKERVLAVAIAHETAKRDAILHKQAKQWTQSQTGDLLNMSVGNVNNALKLAGYIRNADKEIIGAGSFKEAFDVLLLRKEREAQKILAEFISGKAAAGTGITQGEASAVLARAEEDFFEKEGAVVVGGSGGTVVSPSTDDEMPGGFAPAQEVEISLSKTILKGDSIKLMIDMTPGSVDHIITDIPYGIDMDMLAQENASAGTTEQIGSVNAEHDAAKNIAMFEPFLANAYRLLPETGYCVFFLDFDHWEKLRDITVRVGFKVQRWPLIWHKTHTCKNQSAQFNFTKNTEIAMVCRKGLATLITPQGSSVWAGSNESERQVLQHPFVKPFKLWQWIMGAVALKGQKIYDPYAGVGSSTLAAIEAGYVPIASELVDIHYNRLVVNVAEAYKKLHSNVKFT